MVMQLSHQDSLEASHITFRLLFGVLIACLTFQVWDYLVVNTMVVWWAWKSFIHADADSSVIFHSLGITMHVISILQRHNLDYKNQFACLCQIIDSGETSLSSAYTGTFK